MKMRSLGLGRDMFKLLGIALCALIFNACSMDIDTTQAEAAVEKFHKMLAENQIDAIYDESHERLRAATKREDFQAFLGAVNRKLGMVKVYKKTGWKMNYDTSGRYVTLQYETNFADDLATEQFVFLLEEGRAYLLSYHINSNALIVK